MSNIFDFINARLDEDEKIAQVALAALDEWTQDWSWGESRSAFGGLANRSGTRTWLEPTPESRLINRFSPQRVLREVQAKRRILREYQGELDRGPAGTRTDFVARQVGIRDAYEAVLRITASMYSDHPDYDTEWSMP